MNYQQFINEVEQEMKGSVAGKIEISIQDTLKNNGVRRKGLLLQEKGQSMSPTIYLEEYYQQYRTGDKLEDITEALSYVDYFFPNFEEASEMTGETDEAKVADKLYACGVKNVIMKIGKRGCYIRNADGAMIVPACKGVTAIDTIGAGDNFASGFITGLLEGKDIRECAIYANCTAAVSVQYVGATGGVTDKAIVDKMLAKYREDYK